MDGHVKNLSTYDWLQWKHQIGDIPTDKDCLDTYDQNWTIINVEIGFYCLLNFFVQQPMWWGPWPMAILWNRTNISNIMLFSNLSQGPLFFVPCDIGYASLGAINAIKQASLCGGYHTQAIVFAHWELLYLHSAFVICFPLCFVCLFAALFMGRPCIMSGQRMGESRQETKIQD